MTKQELHTCDRCFKEFKVPLESFGEIIEYQINGEMIFNKFELCYECRNFFETWIKNKVD